jgi:hypothetical protein
MLNPMRRLAIALSLMLLAPAWQAGAQPGPGRVPVLAELFTSQGCNSCPPADRILEMLAEEPPIDGVDVIIMSEHVTYWDHQGWRDPFGSSTFTTRQQMYGTRFGLESIFTPQLVIDGTHQIVGTDIAGLKAALASVAAKPKPRLTVELRESTPQRLIAVASGEGLAAAAGGGADLIWALTEDDLVVDVKRGENARRTLRHSGVVRRLITQKLRDAATGQSPPIEIPLKADWKRDRLRVVAFLQSGSTRQVISVASVSVPTPGSPDKPR